MEIQEKILNGARKLFYAYGIRRVTMDEIAGELGISKKTIYEHYDDKSDIVCSLLKDDFEVHRIELNRIKEHASDAISELVGVMKYVSTLYRKINPNFFYDIHKYDDAAWKQFQKFKNNWMVRMIEENIQWGMDEGLYRDSLNVKILSRFRLLHDESQFNPESFPSEQFNLAEVQGQCLEHFIFGIVTLKGHKLFSKHLNSLETVTIKISK